MIIDKIQISGQNYDIRDTSAVTVVDITQADYDELPESAKTENILYNITDATPVDISQYWTSAQTTAAINEATSGKLDTNTYTAYTAATDAALANKVETSAITTAVTTASTDSEIPTAKAVNDAIAAGGGGGGGTTYSAGTNISISNDTINCTLPISARTTSLIYGGGTNTITVNSAVPLNYNNIFGTGNTLSATTNVNSRDNSCNFIYGLDNSLKAGGLKLNHKFNLLFGSGNTIECSNAYGGDTVVGNVLIGFYNQITAQTQYSFVQGSNNISSSDYQFIAGRYLGAKNSNEAAFGTFNVSNTGSTDANKTIFSVGNGTANDTRHNALEIRKNGDIYISSGGTDIKLQDNLGGGGGTVDQTVVSGSTNAVAGGAVYDQLGGMKIVKLTESEYAALVTKDLDTLYVVIPDPSN